MQVLSIRSVGKHALIRRSSRTNLLKAIPLAAKAATRVASNQASWFAASVGSTDPIEASNIVTAVIALLVRGRIVRLPVDHFNLSGAASETEAKPTF